ncbi:MAG TPA: PAS domain-containing protein [Methanoregula sp.]|nr:PAS domain-containing protein [Methanoregula sp.]
MEQLSSENEEILRLFIIAAACIGAVLSSIFSLTHGIFDVFPFLYILPIILCVYFYPKRAVLFTLAISITYIGIIYLLGTASPNIIAISTAWFAIFITIGVVASSYANELAEGRLRIHDILENSQDGIFCFDPRTLKIREMNVKCAGWLRYERRDLVGKEISLIWPDAQERNRFLADAAEENGNREAETLFRAKDGTVLRFVISAVLVTRDRVLCSAIDITGSKIVDEEIRKTLDDLEDQVKARTAHLEKINEELRAEILEHRRFEAQVMPRNTAKKEERK